MPLNEESVFEECNTGGALTFSSCDKFVVSTSESGRMLLHATSDNVRYSRPIKGSRHCCIKSLILCITQLNDTRFWKNNNRRAFTTLIAGITQDISQHDAICIDSDKNGNGRWCAKHTHTIVTRSCNLLK